jgi:Outer membrane protein beta-barrel domain
MRQMVIGVFAFTVCALMAANTDAQARRVQVPRAEQSALGLDFGTFVPSASNESDQLDTALIVTGLWEYYFTPRVSVRPSIGFTEPGLKGSPIDNVRMVPMQFDVNYNWEGGRWHPFVGTGMGAYYLQYRRRGSSLGDSETNLGVNLGGGVEYFLNRQFTLKGELRYQHVGDLGRVDPSGIAFTAGLKRYF